MRDPSAGSCQWHGHTSHKEFDNLRRAGTAVLVVPAWYRSIETRKEIAMAAKVKPIPEGYHTLTPYLVVDGAEKIVRFTKEAFGAQLEHEPTMRPDGKIMHATLKIGDSTLMISDASEHAQATTVMLYLYVPDVDAVYQKALKAGGTALMEPADQFYGDRSGGVKDPAGNRWFIGTHVEDVSPAELKKRAAEFFKQQNKAA
jgi:PhnB protein